MTRKELLALLANCHTGDRETDHKRADSALLMYIDDPEVTEAYRSIKKWYV